MLFTAHHKFVFCLQYPKTGTIILLSRSPTICGESVAFCVPSQQLPFEVSCFLVHSLFLCVCPSLSLFLCNCLVCGSLTCAWPPFQFHNVRVQSCSDDGQICSCNHIFAILSTKKPQQNTMKHHKNFNLFSLIHEIALWFDEFA